jgi:hypothetical protein
MYSELENNAPAGPLNCTITAHVFSIMTVTIDSKDGTTVLQLIQYVEPFGQYVHTVRPT